MHADPWHGGSGSGGGSSGSSRQAWLLGLAYMASLAVASPAYALGGKKPAKDEALISDAYMEQMMELAGPVLSNMGVSGVLGMCAAAALKVGLRAALFGASACGALHVCSGGGAVASRAAGHCTG